MGKLKTVECDWCGKRFTAPRYLRRPYCCAGKECSKQQYEEDILSEMGIDPLDEKGQMEMFK